MIRCWISFFPDAVPWQLTSPHSQRDVNNGLKLVHHVLRLHTRNCYMWPRPLLLSSLTWVHTYSIYWCEDQNIPSIADTSFHHDHQQQTTCKYIKLSPFHNLSYCDVYQSKTGCFIHWCNFDHESWHVLCWTNLKIFFKALF